MTKIVERWTWKVKPGHLDEFVELTKAERERFGQSDEHGSYRIYQADYGPLDIVVGDWVFETEEQQQGAMAEWFAQPEAEEWMEKATGLIESVIHERWYEH
jgi:hypothetical protein